MVRRPKYSRPCWVIGGAVAVAAALIVAGPGQVDAQAGPSVALDPTVASPGDQVTATGAGFSAGVDVDLFLDSLDGRHLADARTGRRGDFTASFAVPRIASGTHTVIACVPTSSAAQCTQRAEAPFRVPPPTTTTRPTTTTTPKLGGPTTTVGGSPIPTTSPQAAVPTTALQPPGGIAGPDTDFPDLRVLAIEVSQGVQDLKNHMPLDAGRRTWVRVYVATDDPTMKPWPNVDGAILLQRKGKSEVRYAGNGPISAVATGGDRIDLNATLTFLLPTAWTDEGEVSIKAFVWSFSPGTVEEKEPDGANNYETVTVKFKPANEPTFILIPLDPGIGPGDPPAVAEIQNAPTWFSRGLLDFHPISDPTIYPLQQYLGPGPEAERPGAWELAERPDEPLERLKWLHALWDMPAGERLFGLVDNSVPTGSYLGWAKSNLNSTWLKPSASTAAHEAGHLRGLAHAGCVDGDGDGKADEIKGGALDPTFPTAFPDCSLAKVDPKGYYALTTYRRAMKVYSNDPASPAAAFPFMSYAGTTSSDPYHYCKLLVSYGITCNMKGKTVPHGSVDCTPEKGPSGVALEACAIAPGIEPEGAAPSSTIPEPVIVLNGVPGTYLIVPKTIEDWLTVSGSVNFATGGARLGQAVAGVDPAAHEIATARDLLRRARRGEVASPYSLRLLGAGAKPLVVVPIPVDRGHGHGDGVAPPSASFVVTIPWVEGVTRIEVVTAAGVAASRDVSPTKPSFRVRAEVVNVSGPKFEITWQTDEGGDLPHEITHTVQVSHDGKKTWRPVATGVTGNRVEVPEGALVGGGKGLVARVIASDGVNTAVSESLPFDLPERKPQIYVTRLDDTDGPTIAFRHEHVRLWATAFDPEDHVLTGRAVRWTSDRDGVLGTGHNLETADLSLGDHVITARAQDSDGNAATAELRLTVTDRGTPAPRIEGNNPEAERLLRAGLAAASGAADGGDSDWSRWIGFATAAVVLLGLALALLSRARGRRATGA